jgi:hypothetical protein
MYYRIKKLCIKLVIKTSLYYDARSKNIKLRKILVKIVGVPAEIPRIVEKSQYYNSHEEVKTSY